MLERGEMLVKKKKKGSTHADRLPHILTDPLVTHVLALCLCVGVWWGVCGNRGTVQVCGIVS